MMSLARSRGVLILDPDPGVARMLATFARELGYSPTVARDPADLLGLAPGVGPGVVLLGFDARGDVRPGELSARLRADPATADAALVALLAAGMAVEPGWAFDACLVK
jgi:CheY-like chemotaxis protein